MGHKECCTGGDVTKILIGGLIGAGVALLLAPQAGRKTRDFLASLAEEVGGKANEAVSDFADTVSEFVDMAGSRASQLLDEKENLTQESKKVLLAALEKAQQMLEEQRKKLEASIG